MFIKMPIARIEFTDNTLHINENSFHYNISNSFDAELLESLIFKGAYASALLYLNKSSLLESINETKVTMNEFTEYLQECKNLLKENVYELEASNLRPLCSINGLEILENDTNIYRGKDKLLVEDFRGVSEVAKMIDDFIASGETDDLKDRYISLLNDISAKENSNEISTEDYAEAIKRVNRAYQELRREEVVESTEGTQTSDIASRRDQNFGGKVVMPPKKKRLEEYNFNVGANHKFKGFTLTPEGRYERGNFVLIKEGEDIKAISKDRLGISDKANRLTDKLNKAFNGFYEFDWRIEDDRLVLYDATEDFDFSMMDENYDKANKIVQLIFGKECYLEAELPPIAVVAGVQADKLN